MASITRSCPNLLRLCAIVLLTAACGNEAVDFGFSIEQVSLRAEPRQLNVGFTQDLRFSQESRDALQHGVALVVSINMELRDLETMTLMAHEQRFYEISYLPLSQRYELSARDGSFSITYPRMRHAVNALSSLNLRFETGLLSPGDYEFRARVKLEQSSLPAPMQLPVLISGKWRHDTDWSSWPFKISA